MAQQMWAMKNYDKWSTSGRESIHSGHFMVSQFEAEAQEDDDIEIIMPDPDANNKLASGSIIDISLAKLFKCMNLAYSQKLTSPKWNRFKGVRLRWKDKIRLNNLIWRCWHMQFLMKKKTPVCQFASPLDVDIHSKPEAVVLEGKYWKRQFGVIKAEYMKWRKFHRHRGVGSQSIPDTTSEFDFDWSPVTNESNLICGFEDYCWTSDTLFSSLNNTTFPFPDAREIAKAGIADFIQPSLGPLQPNLDDFVNGIPFQQLLNSQFNSRLAPVPEESNDEFMKTDYNYPPIMCAGDLETSCNTIITNQSALNNPTLNVPGYGDPEDDNNICLTSNTQVSGYALEHDSISAGITVEPIDHPKKKLFKDKPIMGGGKAFGRRIIHNYEKTQPTQHQTIIYNQFVAQNNNNTNSQQSEQTTSLLQSPSDTCYNPNLFSNISTMNVVAATAAPIIQTTTNNYMSLPSQNALNLSSSSNNMQINHQISNFNQQQALINLLSPPNTSRSSQKNQTSNLVQLLSQKSPQSDHHQHQTTSNSFDNIHDTFKSASNHQNVAYKPYPSLKNCKINQMNIGTSNGGGYNQLTSSQNTGFLLDQQQLPQNTTKEMFRSKSLPLNATLQLTSLSSSSHSGTTVNPQQKDGGFIVPKYQATKPSRIRSNSMICKPSNTGQSMLHTATSEPVLSTLAKLLTTNNQGNSKHITPTMHSSTAQSLFKSDSVAVVNTKLESTQQKQPYMLKMPTNSTMSGVFVNNSQATGYSSNTSESQILISPPGISSSPFPRPVSLASPTADTQRRSGHIHAEQKRRYNIKNGFDMLHSLIPQLYQNPNAKLSKAAMLQKGAEYIKLLRSERATINDKMEILKKERDTLNNSINHLHSVLPANGAPVSRQKSSRVKEMYNEYVHFRTRENWKFWILGLIFKPVFDTFNTTVSVASMEELSRTAILWVDQHCSLMEMRPAVSNQLRYLSTTTDVLSDPPSSLQEEVLKAIS